MADDQTSEIRLELSVAAKNAADLEKIRGDLQKLLATYKLVEKAAEAAQKAISQSGTSVRTQGTGGVSTGRAGGYSATDVSELVREAQSDLSRARGMLNPAQKAGGSLVGKIDELSTATDKILTAKKSELGDLSTQVQKIGALAKSQVTAGGRAVEIQNAKVEAAGKDLRAAQDKLDAAADAGSASAKKALREEFLASTTKRIDDEKREVGAAEKRAHDAKLEKAAKEVAAETQKAAETKKQISAESTATKKATSSRTAAAKATVEAAKESAKVAEAATSEVKKAVAKSTPKAVAAEVARAVPSTTRAPRPRGDGGGLTPSQIARAPMVGGQSLIPKGLDRVASSADKAAAGLDRVASATKQATGAASGPDLIARKVRPAGSLTPPLNVSQMAEWGKLGGRWSQPRGRTAAAGGGAEGAAQGTQRAARAASQFSDSANRAARSANNLSNGFRSISSSAGGATAGIQRVAKSQDAIFGSVKNVLGMAAGYQVLQGIATELGQVFGHLKGGVIGFNAMVEQSTVGFTTLFQNQADQAYAAADGLNEQQVQLLDATKKIDFIRQGYENAEGAATGMIETIREFANVTPFRFAELNESALRMRAFGFELDEVLRKNPETEKFEGGIVAVGNAVSALGGGADAFRRITYALGQMKQAGRVYQNDMMQLANAGIGGYKYIASQLMREITTDGSGSRDKVKAQHSQLFSQLESNAIETVRRLTTNGQISGEAAARAILAGLERDFGGGMEAQAKTFQGAFSTVADTSQSLVADAFKPMFESIRDTTYALGQFLQKDEVRRRAVQFGKVITEVTKALTYVGSVVMTVVVKSFGDFQRVVKAAGDETSKMASGVSLAFSGLFKGVIAIVELLKNDLVRQLVYAAALTKALFAFGAANPLLTQIMIVTTAIGILAQAYKDNTFGFRDAMQSMATAVEPLLVAIRDHIIPLVGEMAGAFSGAVFGVIIAGLEAIMPALQVIVEAITGFLRLIATFKGPVAALGVALAGAFVFNKIVVGFAAISRGVSDLIFKFDRLAMSAKAASQGMVLLPNSMKPIGGPIQMIGPAGPSSPVITGRNLLSGMANRASGIGMAGMLAGSVAQSAAGDNKEGAELASTVANVSTAIFALGALRNVVPAGAFKTVTDGMKGIGSSIGGIAKIKGGPILNVLKQIPLLGGLIGGMAPAFGGLMAALAPLAPVLLAIAAAAAVIYAVGEVQKEERRKETGGRIDELNKFYTGHRGHSTLRNLTQEEINAVSDVEFAMKGRGGQGAAPATSAVPSGPYGTQTSTTSAPTSGYLSTLNQMATTLEDPAEVRAEMVEKYGEKAVGQYERMIAKEKEMIELQRQWRENRANMTADEREAENIAFRVSERNSYIASQQELNKDNIKATKDQMELLVNATDRAAASTDKLNWKLNKAKQQYSEAVQLLQTLATGALQELLNPDSMVNPYTGLEEAGLTMEEIMQMEQEMGFAQFENRSGVTRSFEEYRDILESILPMTEADLVNGKISLKAVERRMSIEKERRKELERIKAIAEAEYDIGLATLQQYDESVNPLQRAVNLRQAQLKYQQDIDKLQFGGIENILDEAKASDEWTAATRATKQRLQEFKQGQEMILQEMTNMFNQYNEDIANILSNPTLSAAQREDAVTKRLEKLYDDLEKNFGITKVMLGTQLTEMNRIIDGTLAKIGNPAMPDINWGGELATAMEKGGFGILSDYLAKKAIRIANLTSQVLAAANPGAMVDKMAITNRDALDKIFGARISAMATAHFDKPSRAPLFVEGASRNLSAIYSKFKKATKYEDILNLSNQIDTLILKYGQGKFARGGQMRSNRIGLVGEQGPELFIPRSSGMVLNNSISSRLMGMLGGAGASGTAGNVTININNPVIRNENDIRKLAQEISRVQASQFRTEGGRL